MTHAREYEKLKNSSFSHHFPKWSQIEKGAQNNWTR